MSGQCVPLLLSSASSVRIIHPFGEGHSGIHLRSARSSASTTHWRTRSRDSRGSRRWHEYVRQWACPGSFQLSRVFRIRFFIEGILPLLKSSGTPQEPWQMPEDVPTPPDRVVYTPDVIYNGWAVPPWRRRCAPVTVRVLPIYLRLATGRGKNDITKRSQKGVELQAYSGET